MPAIPYWFLLKAFFALFIGFWIASRLRGILRAIVVRSMPVRYRMSEEYFNIQTRISVILAVVIGLSIATLTYWGLSKASQAITGPVISRSSSVEIEPAPSPLSFPAPFEEEEPQLDTLPYAETLPENYEEPEPSRIPDPSPPPSFEDPYYLQLHAFVSDTRAWNQKAHWAKRLPRKVHVGIHSGAAVPYKVLAGPFGSRKQAISFREKNKLIGFPRQLGQIQLYE